MKYLFRCFLSFFLLILPFQGKSENANNTSGNVKLAPVFGSHMVLQQNEPIYIWGEAVPETKIHAQLGAEKKETITDKQGKWQVVFSSRKASFEPLFLTVNNLRLDDILIGEVWICSGQSNMQFPLKNANTYQSVLNQLSNNHLRLYNQSTIRKVAKEGYTPEELARCNPKDFFQGEWESSTIESASKASAVAWLYGEGLNQKLNVPVGIIQVAVGGSAMNNWIPTEALKTNPLTSSLFEKDWLSNEEVKAAHRDRAREAFQHVLKPGEPFIPGQFPYRWMCEPGFLFEAGIAPLKQLSFRGLLWYQGESDTDNSKMVASAKELFPLMVNQWRKYLSMGDFPFIYIQLPRYNNEYWPAFREIQRQALTQLKNTDMVVTIDLGEENNIHPKDKRPVGERAVRLALKDVYGFKNLLGFPKLKKWNLKGQEIILRFRGSGKGFLPVEGKIGGFEVAGQDGVFHPVDAKISGTDSIVLNSTVEDPKKLRYAWASFPKPPLNLFNRDKLPLGPFWINFKNR